METTLAYILAALILGIATGIVAVLFVWLMQNPDIAITLLVIFTMFVFGCSFITSGLSIISFIAKALIANY